MNLNEQQKIRIGTCAWTDEGWRGPFYPPDLPELHWLEFYARFFPTVEVDSTFYGPPKLETTQRWLELTPTQFRFSCKLPREITHRCKLRDCEQEFRTFLRAMEPLAPRLQSILVQLPPSFSPDEGKEPLRKFIEQLPADFRFAIEFRDPAWHRPEIIRLLEKHRICWVWADTSPLNERNLAPFEFQPRTAPFLYLRLLGDYQTRSDGEGQQHYRQLLWKREAAIESWALKIEQQLPEVRTVYVYVNNHFEGFAPETCRRLAERLGLELSLPGASEPAEASSDRNQLSLEL